jgi:penicillin-binding protein 1A
MGDMTGGTLPALSWKEIMAYAHRGLEPKPPFGVVAPAGAAVAAAAKNGAAQAEAPARTASLAPQTRSALLEIGEFLRTAQSRAEAMHDSAANP